VFEKFGSPIRPDEPVSGEFLPPLDIKEGDGLFL
jgi:hypothetical protein